MEQAIDPESRLAALGINLPTRRRPVGSYLMAVRHAGLVFLAGHAAHDGTEYIIGTLGADLDVEQGYAAARIAGISALASLKAELGELAYVDRVLHVFGMVKATPDFTELPAVVNGFSDLMVAAFGDKGHHTRSAVGMSALPFGTAVEVEMIVAVASA